MPVSYQAWRSQHHAPPPKEIKRKRKYHFESLSCRKVTEFSSLQILQSGCNPRHLNSKAFLDCSGLHLDYMDYMVIKWIAEQCNPKQSKGNLCNPSAIHCNLGLQFCFAIQINLCNLTAIQEDCSRIAEIAVGLLRLQLDCWDCSWIAEIAKFPQLTYTVGHPTACWGGCVI